MARRMGPSVTKKNATSFGSAGGYALIHFLLLVPLALLIFFSLALLALALRNHTIASASCRWAAWQAQKTMAKQLEELTGLNTLARQLRFQRRLAENELKAAVASAQPELVSAAQLHLSQVISRQILLRGEQQRLLWQARASRAQASGEFRLRSKSVSSRILPTAVTVPGLAVRPVPALDVTPDYVPMPSFSDRQNLILSWRANLLAGIPQWLLAAADESSPMHFSGQCAVTLKPEGNQKWHAELRAAKS